MDCTEIKSLVAFHVSKDISRLFKRFLSILKEIDEYKGTTHYDAYRKEILDIGNDAIRDILLQFDKSYKLIELTQTNCVDIVEIKGIIRKAIQEIIKEQEKHV